MSAHAKYSPSSAERWLACPGSIQASQGIPDRESAASIDGTRAHKCLELFLKNGFNRRSDTGKFLSKSYDTEMIDHAFQAAKTIWGRKKFGAELESERKVRLDHIDKDFWGTLDAAITEDFGVLEIIDFKYGRFIPVSPVENLQLIAYAIGKAHSDAYNFDRISLTIIQPRAPHEGGAARSWDISPGDLRGWESRFRDGIERTRARKAPRTPGTHCFFCPAKSICREYTPDATASLRAGFAKPKTEEQINAQLENDFDGVQVPAERERSRA